MRRTRFPIVAMLAAALLTAGCGGDDTTDEPEDDAQAEAASEVAATGDEPTATASETTEPAEPSDATPQPEPEPEPELQLVPLGTRFEWCGEVQGDLEELVQARAAADEAEAALQEAQAALDAATDELDRAEARQVRDSLTERRDSLRDEAKTSQAFRWLWGHGLLGADEARQIAFERAVDAFLADADPAVVDLLWARSDYEWAESQYNRGIWQTPRESLALRFNAEDVTVVESGVPPVLSVEEAVAAIDDWRIRALAVAEDATASQSENWRAFQLAATVGEVLAAYAALVESERTLLEVQHVANAAWDEAQSALNPSGRQGEVRDAVFAALRDMRDATHTEASFSDADSRIEAIALADTNGMAAFQASLSESCQP